MKNSSVRKALNLTIPTYREKAIYQLSTQCLHQLILIRHILPNDIQRQRKNGKAT